MKFKLALICCSLGLAATNALACYTVYDGSNRVVYKAQESPVDMKRPLHETLPRIFPGGHMVFDNSMDCPRTLVKPVAVVLPQAPSPLLTDKSTAEAMNVPHIKLASGAVLVRETPAQMSPGVVVTSAALPVVANGPVANTNVMGAGPAPVVNTAVMGAGPAQRADLVITELHNPPITAVQQKLR